MAAIAVPMNLNMPQVEEVVDDRPKGPRSFVQKGMDSAKFAAKKGLSFATAFRGEWPAGLSGAGRRTRASWRRDQSVRRARWPPLDFSNGARAPHEGG